MIAIEHDAGLARPSPARAAIEGVRKHAFTLDAHSLPWLEAALPAIAKREGRVVVVGAAGAGMAAEFASVYRGLRVVLVTAGPGPGRLRGVALHEHTEVLRVHADHLITSQGPLSFSACLWTDHG